MRRAMWIGTMSYEYGSAESRTFSPSSAGAGAEAGAEAGADAGKTANGLGLVRLLRSLPLLLLGTLARGGVFRRSALLAARAALGGAARAWSAGAGGRRRWRFALLLRRWRGRRRQRRSRRWALPRRPRRSARRTGCRRPGRALRRRQGRAATDASGAHSARRSSPDRAACFRAPSPGGRRLPACS